MKKIAVSKLPQLFKHIAAQYQLFLPVKESEVTNFAAWSADCAVDLDTLKTANTPKHLFLPQVEDLYTANVAGGDINVQSALAQQSPFMVFGVRACDATALEVLDNVYLSEPVDRFYEARRKAGVIVALACSNPRSACFCKAFDIDAANPDADVATWLIGDDLFWSPLTDKGKNLTDSISDLLEPADDGEVSSHQEVVRDKIASLPLSKINAPQRPANNLLDVFNSPLWDKVSAACISCGSCTFNCPTCQCYDISDFDTGSCIHKFRCWDSCMYSDFTQMAHGNPRKTRKERFRQRFMHKLVYHPENNNGQYSCVGCGRCINQCPAGLNIIKIIKEMEACDHVQS